MLRPYDKYKNVDEVWVEKSPLHWEFKRIKHVLYNRVEKNSPVQTECVLSLSAKNGVELQTQKTDKGGNKPKSDFSKYNLAYKQDLLVNCMNVVSGSSGVSKWYGAISPVYYALHTRNQNSNIRYYHYLFRFKPFYRSLLRFSKGILMHESDNGNLNTVRMRISTESLNNINISIPPREEQDQIVKYLDWKTSKINTLIRAKKKQIELLKEQKQAVINKAVTKGIDDTVPMKDTGIEWLGKVPEHWEVGRFKNGCAMINRGITPHYTEDDKNSMVVNQATFSKGYWDVSKIRYTLTSSKENRGLLQANDVLIASTGGGVLGKVYHYNEEGEFIADSHVTIIRCNEKLNSKFVYYNFFTKYDLINAILAQGSTNQTELQRAWLVSFNFQFPPLKEQREIVTYLEEKTALIDKAIVVIEKEIELVSEYKTSLISSVITGEVDVRGVTVPEFDVVEEVIPEINEELKVDIDDNN
jgi:type I restriction enzyme S subunit